MATSGEPVRGKGLKADALSFKGALAIGLDSTAPAYSLAAVIGIIVATVGLQAPAVLLIAFVPMFLTSLAYAAMNRVDPDCGTTFAWVTRAFGPFAGWWSGWLVTATGILVIGSLADVAAQYTFLLVDWDSAAGSREAVAALAVVYIAVACTVTVLGTELSGRLQEGMVVVQIGALLVFAVVTIVKSFGDGAVDPSLTWLNPFEVEFSALAAGLVTAVFIYWGWESAVAVNEETQEPDTVPSRAAVTSTVILVGTYVLVAFAAQAWLGADLGETYNDDVTVLDAIAADSLGSPLDKLVTLAVLTSALAATQTTILPASRTTLSMAARGAFPALFGRVHPRFQTPWLGTIVISLLAAAWYLPLKFASENFLFDTISALGLLIALYYAATGYASAFYFRRRPGFLTVWGPLAGALILTAILVKAVSDFADPANSYSGEWLGVGPPLVIGTAFTVLGLVGAAAWRLGPNRRFFDARREAAE